MTTKVVKKDKYFCIFDYFLDGIFLKWEEIKGECPILTCGDDWVINLDDGTQITAKIVSTEVVSESERRIFLSSS